MSTDVFTSPAEDRTATMQRLRIRHETNFVYDNEVVASYNEVRMTPISDQHQTTLHSRLDIRPTAAALRYRDYWGTEVSAFDVNVPHRELQVTATSLIDAWEYPEPAESVGWQRLADPATRDSKTEFLRHTPRTEPNAELADLVADVVRGDSPDAAARAASSFVHDQIEYVPGATGVHTSVTSVWCERKGVCQDIAHLSIAMLRTAGIPARYVSGYLHPKPEADIGEPVIGQSHAWVEWWDGSWQAYDPTNAIPAGPQHVVVARGREYADVAPFKGLYSGDAGSRLDVSVEITRLS